MNFKKFSTKGRSPYSSNKTRVRKSYYTFSREYPAGNIPLERMNHYTIRSKKTKKSLSVLLVLLPPVPFRGGWQITLELLPSFFLASLFSALLLPFFILMADGFSGLLKLRTYTACSRYRRTDD